MLSLFKEEISKRFNLKLDIMILLQVLVFVVILNLVIMAIEGVINYAVAVYKNN